jgi:hypothetical protein
MDAIECSDINIHTAFHPKLDAKQKIAFISQNLHISVVGSRSAYAFLPYRATKLIDQLTLSFRVEPQNLSTAARKRCPKKNIGKQ